MSTPVATITALAAVNQTLRQVDVRETTWYTTPTGQRGAFEAAQGGVLGLGHLGGGLAAPGRVQARPPAAKTTGWDAIAVQHVPARFVGGLAAGAEPVHCAIVVNVIWHLQASGGDGGAELVDVVSSHYVPPLRLASSTRQRASSRCL